MSFLSRIFSSGKQSSPVSCAPALRGGGGVFARSGYDIVESEYDQQRREAVIERKGEDGILPASKRLKLTNLMRAMMRNSPLRVQIDQQWRVNVVGSVGGRMYAAFPTGYESAAAEVMRYFNKIWFPRAEFSFRQTFNWLLKTCLTSMDDGGNVILVFDDGILTGGNGTGRIRAFEGDEIADVDKFDDFFRKGCVQSQGFVYDPSGMFCGAFLSTHQRGRTVFAKQEGVLCLRRDPYSDDVCNWSVLGDMRRFNQGRAISPLAAALSTLIDANEANTNERLATKFNAQMLAALKATDPDTDFTTQSPFAAQPADAALAAASGAALAAQPADAALAAASGTELDTSALRRNSIAIQKVPYGSDLSLLDTKHPNNAMDAFLERLAGNAGGTKGLGRFYSTGRVMTSYTAFRGEQVMSWMSFEEAQKELERNVCDWAARCAISRALRLGLIKSSLPDGWEGMIAWLWPKMREVSEKDALAATKLKMELGLTSRQRELPPGDVAAIESERIKEKQLDDDAGFIYPGTTTVSGAFAGDAPPSPEHQIEEDSPSSPEHQIKEDSPSP